MFDDAQIVMCGCCEVGYYLIQDLIKDGVKFSYFVTLTPEQGKQHNVSGYKDFRPLAEKYNIPVYYPKEYSLNSIDDMKFFSDNRFDLLIQGGWQRLFPDSVINTLSIGAIGVHGSSDYLPKGRGRSPLNWSLIEGKKRFIMHLFFIRAGVDDGDVFDSEAFDINEFDTIETLYYKNYLVTRKMLIRSLPKIIDGNVTVKKQIGQPSYYPKRTPEDGKINWEDMDVYEIYNFVRAQTRPYPGAYAEIHGKMYKIWHCQVFDTRITYPEAEYGQCVEYLFDKNTMIVNCRGGLLLVDDYEEMTDFHDV
ncbi:MAG TPA: hypothetical protein DDX29_01370 [Clostridiales bacterium]|nr:hypothetical protein [Clostridiales bacterium]